MNSRLFIIYICIVAGYGFSTAVNTATDKNVEIVGDLYTKRSNLPIWSNLTSFELEMFKQLNKANSGDADALLMLYLTASGDSRSFAKYNQHLKSINGFVKGIASQIHNEPSEWRKGFILLQGMHEQFFLGGKSDSERGYSVEQSQLSDIFKSKKFNCISSSLLFTVLARKFDLDVKGVLLPSHAFVQLTLSNGKVLDIETTTITGYDWVHDEDFYKKMDVEWFQQRGLVPSSFEDYKNRDVVSPLMLGIDNMSHQHTAKSRMDERSRSRIVEILSTIEKSNIEAHKARMFFYNNEFVRLNEDNNYNELDRMYQKISSFLDWIQPIAEEDIELANMTGWVGSQRAFVATKKGQNEKALKIARKTMEGLNNSVEDKNKIISNIYSSLNLITQSYTNQEKFTKAIEVYQGRHAECVLSERCSAAVAYLYSKWASSYWDKKQWTKVIEKYQAFLTITSKGKAINSFKENMQSAYVNWANEYYKNGDWVEVNRILSLCVTSMGNTELCQNNLNELRGSHQLD